MFGKTPLAWYQVTRERTRLLVAIAGITFANILIFMQLGFLDALFDGATRPHRTFCGDIVLTNPKQHTFFSPKSFSRQRLFQALGYKGVESVASVLVGTVQWRNPVSSQIRSILVFGVDPLKATFNLAGVQQSVSTLKIINRVLFDRDSRPEYGPIAELFNEKKTVETELNGKRIKVSGLFSLGASFAADGTVITSDTTFADVFNRKGTDNIEVGLIKVTPGADVQSVKEALKKAYGNDIAVNTMKEFAEVEKNYWATSSGIGFIFGLGVVVGFIVGVVIVYQILYADVSDHLAEYATLKAIGYTDRYLLAVLIQESMILACFGYAPGLGLSLLMYWIAQTSTLLPIYMTAGRALLVFVLTIAMCSISAAIAMRKLRSADPADIF